VGVEVFQIISRRKKAHRTPFERMTHNIKDFVLKFDKTIDSALILAQKDIIPYWIDFKKKHVIFAEMPKPADLSHASFITDGVYESANKLYFIPFPIFLSLADSIKSLPVEVVLGACTPRSGSTLMCKLLSRTKSVFAMSQPACLNLVERKYSLKSGFGQALFKALILFLGQFVFQQGKKILYIRPMFLSDFDIIDRLFNISTKKIITWRGPFESMKSLFQKWPINFSNMLFILWLIITSYDIYPVDTRELRSCLFQIKKTTRLQKLLIGCWILPMIILIKSAEKTEKPPLVLHYDDLISYSHHELIELVLNYLGLQDEFSEEMILELSRDSQAGTAVGRDKSLDLPIEKLKIIKKNVDDYIGSYTYNLGFIRNNFLEK